MAARDERRDVEEGGSDTRNTLSSFSVVPLPTPRSLFSSARQAKKIIISQDNKHTSSMDARHGLDRHLGEMTWQ